MILTGVGIIRGIGPSPTPTSPLAVAVGNMSGSIGIVNWYSTNVSNWVYSAMASNYLWRGVEWSPNLGIFCAISDRSNGTDCVQTSTDGINWTTATSVPANVLIWSDICWSPQLGLFCAVGYSASIASKAMTSPDGLTWTIQTVPNNNKWQRVCWSQTLGLFCAVSPTTQAGGTTTSGVMTSPDGITWTARTTTAAWKLDRIEWSPNLGLFCVTGADNTFILTSPDGINWTSRTLPSGTPNFNSIAWSPPLGLFCIVGNSGYVCTSSDGITWTTGSSGNSWAWQDICWSYSLNRFAAVGSSGPNGAGATFYSAMYSTDGITWVNPSTPYNTVATINYGLSVNAIASN